MEAVVGVVFALLVGLTVGGLSGSLMELVAERRLGFAEPFVSRRHVFRSLGSAAAAGPFMLANDALEAWRERSISAFVLVSCALTATIWALATGVAVIGLVPGVASLLF